MASAASDGPARDSRPGRRRQGGRGPKRWVPLDEFGEPTEVAAEDVPRLRERAFNLCVWYLGQAAKTRHQLWVVMERKGVPESVMEEVLARLEELGYVDDRAFAESFVRSRHEVQRKGSRVIQRDLAARGVDAGVVEEALAGVSEDAELENARVLVERKLRSSVGLPRQKRVTRLVGMLTRRGYGPGVAFRVVNEALDGECVDTD